MSIIKGKTNTVAGVGKNGTGFTLFTPIWQDHLVNNASWLRADTFSWQSGSVYVAAYNHLIADFNGTTSSEETIGSTTITYYRAADGHKIVLPDQENNVMAIYNATGISWYYILDTTNQRFKLPRNKYGFNGLRDNVGNYVAPGLPNITGSVSAASDSTAGNLYESGAFQADANTRKALWWNNNAAHGIIKADFNASRSSSIYGNSDTVQPPAVQTYLYFFVGNTVEEVTTINVGQLTESLNGKADTSLNNVPTNYDYVVESKLPTTDDPTWYRVYKSGWVEQGGAYSGSFNLSSVHSLLKPFSSTDYIIVGNSLTTSNESMAWCCVNRTISTFTGESFRGTTANGTYSKLYWEAKGQGAN